MDGRATENTAPVPTRIGVAVVEWRGRYLVGRRPETGPLAGYDEFPGGKCQPGETPAACAVRECLEETGLDVFAVDLLMHRTFEYPHGLVDLEFWLCRPSPRVQEQVPENCEGYIWLTPAELPSRKFPEGNGPLIELLSRKG